MSNNLFRIFSAFTRTLSIKSIPLKPSDISFNLLCFLLISGAHASYAFSTHKKEDIKVKSKYIFINHGFTNFMIVDNKGRHFNVNNSLWYWKWDSIEDWEKINKNDIMSVRYYGLRVPIFGLFPNIIFNKDVNDIKL